MCDISTDRVWFKQCISNHQLCKKLAAITVVMCDVDGTLTNAGIYVSQDGEGGRVFSVQDGYIVKPSMHAGLAIVFISGKNNRSACERAKSLGIPEDLCFAGMESKLETVKALQKRLRVSTEQLLIYGDDFMDAEVKREGLAGLYLCPANTPFYFKPTADVVIPRGGGDGAFRLMMDLMLYIRGQHFAQKYIEESLAL
jgi:3-deoxy-D-manno-octulosonate 8-phosphate phosphatase (KDO 8-P phosphatase)